MYEAEKGFEARRHVMGEMPTFSVFAERYLDEDAPHRLARTALRDRKSNLRKGGPIESKLGRLRLDEITAGVLRQWWAVTVDAPGLSLSTGRNYLDAIAAVFGFARDLDLISESPVDAFRAQLRRRQGTKRGRSEAQASEKIYPVGTAEELGRLSEAIDALPAYQADRVEKRMRTAKVTEYSEAKIQAARLDAAAHGERIRAFLLLQLDAGLRVGEAIGLRWEDIAWGDDEGQGRHLVIRWNRPRGGAPEPPKSGRTRKVGLSLRLRDALIDLYEVSWQPSPEAEVLAGIDDRNVYKREWKPLLKRAGLPHYALKDLRDTFASWLLTAGVQLAYVSKQLGHADVQVTARHYAKWVGDGEEYVEPMRLEVGELPCDLLFRVPTESPQSETADVSDTANPRPSKDILCCASLRNTSFSSPRIYP